ncbi:MAG: 2TM domain-containing protein [Cyanobacteria bacterium J06628_4]
MGLLFLIDLMTGGVWWFYWPLFGWGIGIVAHAVSVFGGGWLGSEWERKKIEDQKRKGR